MMMWPAVDAAAASVVMWLCEEVKVSVVRLLQLLMRMRWMKGAI